MKKQIAILTVSMLAASAFAQHPAETNRTSRASGGSRMDQQTNAFKYRRGEPDDSGRRKKTEQKRSDEQRRSDAERRLKLMERELKKIGVTEEQKAQITELQKDHKEKMAANAQEIAKARKKLSALLDSGASMEALEAAIQEISSAQAAQLRILVRNRLEMERILGKEKNAAFMKNARAQFEKHGRRGGPPLPPRPELPPRPDQQGDPPKPPETPPST